MKTEAIENLSKYIKKQLGDDVMVQADHEKFSTLYRRDKILFTRVDEYKRTYVTELAIQYNNDMTKNILQEIETQLPKATRKYDMDSLLTVELQAEISVRANELAEKEYEELILECDDMYVIIHHSEKGETFLETMANIGFTVWIGLKKNTRSKTWQ